MAWSAGHTHEVTMSLPATADGALVDYTYPLTELDFAAADRGALADAFAADDVECAIDSAGAGQVAIDVLAVDTTANTFILRVGPVDTSSVSVLELFWRYGSTSAVQVGTAAYDANWAAYWPDGAGADRTSNSNNGVANNGLVFGGVSGPSGNMEATDFDRASDHFSRVADSASLDGFSAISVIGWVKPETINGLACILSKRVDNNAPYIVRSSVGTAPFSGVNKLLFGYDRRTNGGEAANWETGTNVLTAGSWTHFGFAQTYGSTPVTASIDGVSESGSWASGTGNQTPEANAADATIGRLFTTTTGDEWDGAMSGLSLHSTARSLSWFATEHSFTNTLGQATTPAFTEIGGGGATLPIFAHHYRQLAGA